MTKHQRPVYWLVEMRNRRDRRDDEVWQIRAVSAKSAVLIAQSGSDSNRFTAGYVVPARGGSAGDRVMAKDLRNFVTKRFP